MTLIYCPECNKEISDRAAFCPGCGYPEPWRNISIVEQWLHSQCGYPWHVLTARKTESLFLVITKDVIAIKPFNEVRAKVTWENSTLRKWLNEDYYQSFPQAVKNSVIAAKNMNTNYSRYRKRTAPPTIDNVFLLSVDEFEKYFSDGKYVKTKSIVNDPVRAAERASMTPLFPFMEYESWWLRSGGKKADRAVKVDAGSVRFGKEGISVDYFNFGVRPAMWVNMEWLFKNSEELEYLFHFRQKNICVDKEVGGENTNG